MEGGDGVFIEWCESLCNDRSLMKCSFGFWFTVRWVCGSFRDRGGIPELIPRYTANRRGSREGGGGPTSNNSSPSKQTLLIFISPIFCREETWRSTRNEKIRQMQTYLHSCHNGFQIKSPSVLPPLIKYYKQATFSNQRGELRLVSNISSTGLSCGIWAIKPSQTLQKQQWHEQGSPEWRKVFWVSGNCMCVSLLNA